jgi:phage-related protein
MGAIELLKPTTAWLPSYVAALRAGWSAAGRRETDPERTRAVASRQIAFRKSERPAAAESKRRDHRAHPEKFGRAFLISQASMTIALYTHVYIINGMENIKTLRWIASSKKDLKAMPEVVQDTFGFALHQAQIGLKHIDAKALKGFGSAGVLEVVESAEGGTYRAVYTVRFADAVYVLHCFQKKSTHGITTPKPDMDLIRDRLKIAEELAKERK